MRHCRRWLGERTFGGEDEAAPLPGRLDRVIGSEHHGGGSRTAGVEAAADDQGGEILELDGASRLQIDGGGGQDFPAGPDQVGCSGGAQGSAGVDVGGDLDLVGGAEGVARIEGEGGSVFRRAPERHGSAGVALERTAFDGGGAALQPQAVSGVVGEEAAGDRASGEGIKAHAGAAAVAEGAVIDAGRGSSQRLQQGSEPVAAPFEHAEGEPAGAAFPVPVVVGQAEGAPGVAGSGAAEGGERMVSCAVPSATRFPCTFQVV